MGFKPRHGVTGLKAVKGPQQFFVTTGVVLAEGFGVKTCMGEVAAPTSGNFDFGQELIAFFDEHDLAFGIFLFVVNGGKETGGTATYNNDFHNVLVSWFL